MTTKDTNKDKDANMEFSEEQVNNAESQETAEAKTDADASEEGVEEITEEIDEITSLISKELEELKDKHIRLQAEFDNFRRRTMKEKTELIKSGGERVLLSVISIVDDLDRGLAAYSDMDDDNPLKQGILLISSKFHDFLKQNGVTELDAKGADFDTDLHEAITEIPAPSEDMKGKVVDVVQKGYLLNDKVLRYAKVVVGK